MIKVSLQIRELIRNKQYEEAYKICCQERFNSNFHILSQIITCLIKLGRINKALTMCNEDRFKDYFPIQSQRITCLLKLGRIEEALNLCNEERFKYDFLIQSQRITCLIKLKRYEEALNICSEERFSNYRPIKKRKNYLTKKFESKKPTLQIDSNNETNKVNILAILESIKNKTLSLEDLNNLLLPEYQKAILTVAIYEAFNYDINISIHFLKTLKQKYNDNKEMLTIIKKLNERLKTKRKLFDIDFYLKLLSTSIVENQNIKAIQDEKENILRLINVLNIMRAERTNATIVPDTPQVR